MTFPQTILPIRVDLALDGATWTDVTPDVLAEQQIRITRGRSDWGQQVDHGRCTLTFKNPTGKYSPKNPLSPLYGKIGRNTPIRVSVLTGSVALDLPGNTGDYASTPDTAALDITGDIDIRIDATLVNWIQADYPSAGQADYPRTELIAKRAAGQVSWALHMVQGRPYFEWSADGTNTSWVWASVDVPLTTSGRLALRVTLDVDNGAGGKSVVFYTAETMAGPWVPLDSGTFAGTTSIFSGTAPLRIGDASEATVSRPALGRVHAAEVRSGIDGTLVAAPDFTAQPSGTASFADAAGRTWTVAGGAEITNRKSRFVGEVSAWTPKWETGGKDVTAEVEAAGVLRRLGQGAVPTKSPFYREFTSPGRMAAGIVAYWPMEDASDATRLASAYSGHPAMITTAGVSPAAYTDWVASGPLPTIGSGSIRVAVPAYSVPAGTRIGWFTKVPAAGTLSTQRLMSLSQTGTAATWSVWINTSGQLAVRAYDADSVLLHDSGFGTDSINGLEKYFVLTLTTSGANVSYSLLVVDIAASMPTAVPDNVYVLFTISGTVTAATTSRITAIRFGEDAGMNGTAIGHLAIGNSTVSFTASVGVMVGWNAEEAASRTARIGYEEGIHSHPTGPGDERCGWQPAGTALEIMRAAGDVDEGILAEQRTVLGLRYVTRASMYNQTPALTLDYRGDDGLVTPLAPTDDDQGVTNDVTVARSNGSSARVTQSSGALSTQPPPAGIGLYDTSYTLNLLDDRQPLQHAGWRLHLGTWDETRFPQVTVNLANAPGSIEAAAGVDTGSRIEITHPPVWLPPDTMSLLVQGYSEVIDQFTWTIVYNCSPAGPWDVAWAGGSPTAVAAREFQWVDTDGSQLAEDLDATETAVDVFTTTGPVWTPRVADTPFDWRVGGEVMTVTAPGALLNTNSFFDTGITGWTGSGATISHQQIPGRIPPHPRARATMQVVPDGVSASGGATCTATPVDSITPGATYTASMWVFCASGWSDLRPTVDWSTSAGTYISTSLGTGTAVAAGRWTYVEQDVTAPATASRGAMGVRHGGTPGPAATYHVWAARLTRKSSSWAYDTFSRTSASGWGTSDSGLAWASVGGGAATDYTVSGSYASHVLSTVDTVRRSAVVASVADFDIYCDIATSAAATGDTLYGAVCARMADAANLYMARVDFLTNSNIIFAIRRIVGGVDTQLGLNYVPLTPNTGSFVRVRFQGTGSTLRAKIWRAGDMEPSVWRVQTTDTALTAPGQIGTRSMRLTGNTNAATVEIRYDNFEVVNPQTYTVVRSQNGIVKAHSAGAAVVLAQPAYTAL